MDEATKQAALTLLRTMLITIGGIATAKGWVTETDWQTYSGAALVIAPSVWAVWASMHKVKKADEREAVALNAGITLSNQSQDPVPPVPKEEAKAVIQTVTEGTKP